MKKNTIAPALNVQIQEVMARHDKLLHNAYASSWLITTSQKYYDELGEAVISYGIAPPLLKWFYVPRIQGALDELVAFHDNTVDNILTTQPA